MEILYNTLIVVIPVTLVIITVLLAFILVKLNKFFSDVPVLDEHLINAELSPAEKERMQRNIEFDRRIHRMTKEIADEHITERHGSPAEELHPMVHNLPHDAVLRTHDVLPDVEVSE